MANSELKRLTVRVELADGTILDDLKVRNPALVAFDFERKAKKWPPADEAPMLWQTFIAWRQAKNDGLYAGDFPTWRDTDCLEVDQLSADAVDPTTSTTDSDSSSDSQSSRPGDSTT